jgi:hypothetical protein
LDGLRRLSDQRHLFALPVFQILLYLQRVNTY